jgi:xanthine dehydrogenase iron-sulfur cluster and FAD-binding subunit A
MYPFTYHRPTNLAEAKHLFQTATEASFLSGGHTLLPALKQRLAAPSDVVDLWGMAELQGIAISGDHLTIGGGMVHSAVAESAIVRAHIPAPSADRSPTMIRRRIILPPSWRWMALLSPIDDASPPMIISLVSMRRRESATKLSPRLNSPCRFRPVMPNSAMPLPAMRWQRCSSPGPNLVCVLR